MVAAVEVSVLVSRDGMGLRFESCWFWVSVFGFGLGTGLVLVF